MSRCRKSFADNRNSYSVVMCRWKLDAGKIHNKNRGAGRTLNRGIVIEPGLSLADYWKSIVQLHRFEINELLRDLDAKTRPTGCC
ncbi:MAG: hypothetical protein IJ301_05055 [Clostridia bacterium]|nr:hypothetical protein [Clostridia bacterium]